MLQQRTVPGVYIKELNAFPNSVVEVATALPVFIGYTQTNEFQGKPLKNKVVQVTSLSDYIAFFENDPTQTPGPNIQYTLTEFSKPSTAHQLPDITLNGKPYVLDVVPSSLYYMYNSIQLFFQNGGGTCYIMSIGTYGAAPQKTDFLPQGQPSVFDTLKAEQDPTMIVMPDTLLLPPADYFTIMNEALSHCNDVQSRMVLMDMYAGNAVKDQLTFLALQATQQDPINVFRAGIGTNYLNYGASYYPWVNTNVVGANQITFANISGGITAALLESSATITSILALPSTNADQALAKHNALLIASVNYQNIMRLLSLHINCLPVAPAIAGAISAVDATQGVWKAPANVSLNSVQSAVLSIDDDLQSNMNVDALSGKSVNAIRSFRGLGVLIWGARTLDGNSQDWRYINVRRTLIMIEQSIKLAARSYVFEANDANTWLNLKSEIENFLTGIWKQGGLAGSKPEEAFSVSVGLGSTMTAQDILDGYLDVAVLVAVTHPAEFIEISFKQQLQKS
jgi:uncharacterized protein